MKVIYFLFIPRSHKLLKAAVALDSMRLSTGTHISFSFHEKPFNGTIIQEEEDTVVVKLDSGYNISARPGELKNIKEVKQETKKQEKVPEVKQDATLPKIAVLHTGGTIASKVDYETGSVISRYSAEELLALVPELKKHANITSRLLRNMWSEDMRFAHYNLLAEEVKKEVGNVAGIIITHGTDTMHYTSAALSFILENVPLPVVLVGAQRSSDRGSGDGALNLLAAVRYIKENNPGVTVCMHETSDDNNCVILPGTRCRKMHTSTRDAFKAINDTPVAKVTRDSVEIFRKTTASGTFAVRPMNDSIKTAIVKVHTNMRAEQFAWYKGYKGLVIEGTGIAGNAPINEIDKETKEHSKIAEALKALAKSGTLLCATSQTIHGRLSMNVYTTGRKMQEIGIIGHMMDMTPETAYIKLSWLLSNYDKKDAKELYLKNLRGEISPFSILT